MTELSDKVVWITGAGTGIGRAAALALANAGAIVALTGRRIEPLHAVAAEIAASRGLATVHTGDLTGKQRPSGIAAEIAARHGRIDILVNNAGVNITDRTWSKLTPDGIEALIAGNLASAFYCAAAVLPAMRTQGGGQLIHIASMSGRYIGVMSGPVYTAAKHGVVAMSHNLNMEECVNGIRSTVICPSASAPSLRQTRSASSRAYGMPPARSRIQPSMSELGEA